MALTKLDILDGLAEIKIAVAYKHKGETLESFPASMNVLENVDCEYVSFEGWKTSICACRTFDELPANAKKYVKFIENFLGVPGKILDFFLLFS